MDSTKAGVVQFLAAGASQIIGCVDPRLVVAGVAADDVDAVVGGDGHVGAAAAGVEVGLAVGLLAAAIGVEEIVAAAVGAVGSSARVEGIGAISPHQLIGSGTTDQAISCARGEQTVGACLSAQQQPV